MKKLLWSTVAGVAAFAISAACSSDQISAPLGAYSTLEFIPNDANLFLGVPGRLKICVFDGEGDFTTSAAGPGAVEANTHLDDTGGDACSITYVHPGGATGAVNVTATQVGPSGFYLYRLSVLQSGVQDPIFNQEFPLLAAQCNDPPFEITPASRTVAVTSSVGFVIYFKQCPPIPEQGECNGLTPGFWKNWDNHYTAAQFASLIPAWVPGANQAQKVANATNILKTNNPEIPRLRKFLLANQLTLALVANPALDQKGFLDLECESEDGSDLGDLIDDALELLANLSTPPTDAQKALAQLLGTKLDQIANLGDD